LKKKLCYIPEKVAIEKFNYIQELEINPFGERKKLSV